MPLEKRRHVTSLPVLTPAGRFVAADPLGREDKKLRVTAEEDSVVERHRYAKLLLENVRRYQQFSSVDLFVETLLRDIALQDGVSLQTQAVVASWAMKLLCNGSPSERVMTVLVDAVFPAIYRDYDERRLDYAPAAIQALLCDRRLIRDNPYFSHSTYMCELSVSNARIDALSEQLQRASSTNMQWKKIAVVFFESAQAECKKRTFLAWRAVAKRRRVDAMLRRKVIIRQNQRMRCSSLGAAFFRWRLAVETSRTEYLTEQLHRAAFQLENSKSQFQMQCIRTDKMQLNYEQGELNMQALIEERNALKREVNELNEKAVQREKDHRRSMAANVQGVLSLMLKQRKALKRALGALLFAKEIAAGWLEEALIENEKLGALEDVNADAEERDIPTEKRTSGNTVSDYPEGHVLLLKWCNHILLKGPMLKKPRQVSNFASDFADGVVYLLVLEHVFQEKRRRKPLPSTISVEERLRYVCGMAETTPLAIALVPDDFKHQREDKIFLSLAEIFAYHVEAEKRAHMNMLQNSSLSTMEFRATAGASTAASLGDDAENDNDLISDITRNEETIRTKVWEWNEDLERWTEELQSNLLYDGRLQNCREAITREAAHIARGRSKGRPVHLVTFKNAQQFINLSSKRLDDLRARFKLSNALVWKEAIRTDLRDVLWKHAQLIASTFYHYAGADARVMHEAQFWRFAEESGLMVEPLTPTVITQIFDMVVSPHLVSLLRLNAKDEKQSVMSEIAQEMEMRFVKPLQFTEILVRMALTQNPGSLTSAMDRFLSTMKPPTMVGALPMTQLFYEVEPQHVVAHFLNDIARVFFFYIKQQLLGSMRSWSHKSQGYGRFATRLYYATYLRMFTDCNFVVRELEEVDGNGSVFSRKTRFMSAGEVQGMLGVLHRRIPSLPPDEICFSLFVESFGVACTYWWPDPSVHLSRKLAAFLSIMLKKLSAVYIKDTLLLSEQPQIPLQGDDHVDFEH